MNFLTEIYWNIKWKIEDAFFAHPIHLDVQGKSHHQQIRQVPVAGVRGGNHHAFVNAGRQSAFEFPTGELQKTDRAGAQNRVHDGRVEQGTVHEKADLQIKEFVYGQMP